MSVTAAEARAIAAIKAKDEALRSFLAAEVLAESADPSLWLTYLAGIKAALGNLNNDLGFVATLLVKQYLAVRFAITTFDAAGKAQGAAGVDIDARTADGQTIEGELKTTTPYQPGFGAKQKETIAKDLARLSASAADHRLMFVTDPDTFAVLCRPAWAARAPGVEIVDLVTGRTFACPGSRLPADQE